MRKNFKSDEYEDEDEESNYDRYPDDEDVDGDDDDEDELDLLCGDWNYNDEIEDLNFLDYN